MKKRDNVRVLLVEDEPSQVALGLLAIRKANDAGKGKPFVTDIARDGQEAIDVLDEKEFDLILLDLKLPRVNGLEVLHHIKTDKKLRVIPVFILTTSDLDKDIASAYDAHVNGYIVKPLNQPKLTELMGNLQQFWTMEGMRLAT
jgi:CheY-like chemotaxis protein